jgi:hypothetical protein
MGHRFDRIARRVLSTAVLIVVLGACSDDGSNDDAAADRATSTTSTSRPRPTSTTVPSPTTTAPPSALAVVVTADEVAGWWDGQAWVEADGKKAVPVNGGEEYAVLGLVGPAKTATGSPLENGCELSEGSRAVKVPGVDHKTRPPMIAVSGVPAVRPRETTVLDPASEVYRDAAAQVLRDKGLDPETVNVVQVVRADLEGDDKDEVLVVAERIAEPDGPYGRKGDYSIVFLRRIGRDAVITTIVRESFTQPMAPGGGDPLGFIESFRVSAVADLNGDGRMEVALWGEYYEGAATAIHELRPDGTIPAVMSGGCGA